jgi:hypothetical protein
MLKFLSALNTFILNTFHAGKVCQLLSFCQRYAVINYFKDCLAYYVKQVLASLHLSLFCIKLVRVLKKQKSIFLKSRIR